MRFGVPELQCKEGVVYTTRMQHDPFYPCFWVLTLLVEGRYQLKVALLWSLFHTSLISLISFKRGSQRGLYSRGASFVVGARDWSGPNNALGDWSHPNTHVDSWSGPDSLEDGRRWRRQRGPTRARRRRRRRRL